MGPPVIEFGDERLWPQAGKTSALLLYLAYRSEWASRVDVAQLFWRDVTERTARTNLRSLLSRTPSTRAYAENLEVEASRVRWRVATDVAEFQAAVSDGHYAEAFGTYGGDLLDGFVVEGAPGFDEWLAREREALQDGWRTAGLEVSRQLEASGEWLKSAEVLDRLARTDPFDESLLRRLLVALSNAGKPDRARDEYNRFAAWLAEEVGAEPEPETASLVSGTGDGQGGQGLAGSRAPSPAGRAQYRLPTPVTPTVGRAAERAHVAGLLRDGARLVTLSGPGGIGKTRLALAVAHDLNATGTGGDTDATPSSTRRGSGGTDLTLDVRFVPCETADGTDELVAAIADAVGLPLIGPGQPRRQLLDYLAPKRMLLVLDNLEQLRGRLDVLDEILERSPDVSILTTSRELVGSRHEHVVDVRGLATPPAAEVLVVTEVVALPALELFMSCALRVRPDFRLTDANVEAVTRICRMVDGMPLAIELATSWLRAVTPEEVAGEIARGLDILAAAVSTETDRHRSVRVTFDYSWSVLPHAEQHVLARLSVFAGAFYLNAAAAIAGATVTTMAALVNKSLLAQTGSGRYVLHPLLRSYAAEKLSAEDSSGASLEKTRRAHRLYFSTFLDDRGGALRGGDQLRALNEIADEIDDVRAAWEAALEDGYVGTLGRQAPALTAFYTFRSRFHEMLAQYSTAARRLRDLPRTEEIDTLLGFMLAHVGWSGMRLGRYQEAEAVLLEATARPSPGSLEPRYPAGDPRLPLSLMASIRGEFGVAAGYAQAALEASQDHGNSTNERIAHYALARAAIGMEQFGEAEDHIDLALASSERDGDRWFQGDCLLQLGDVALGLGRAEEADRHYLAGLEICVEFGNRGGVAEAMNRRAAVALWREDHDAAHRLYLESLAVSESVGDGREIARAECGLGAVLSAKDQLRTAASHYRRALRHAAKLRSWPLVRRIANGASRVVPDDARASGLRKLAGGTAKPAELSLVVDDLERALANAAR